MKLGEVFYRMQNFAASLRYYEKARSHIVEEYGENHPLQLDCLKTIGNVYLNIEDLD